MKKYIIVVLIVVIAVALFATSKKTIEVTNPITVETKEVVQVEVDTFKKQVADAKAASSTEIEARSMAAYHNAKYQAELEIELDVTRKNRQKLEAREKELQKESVAY